MMITIVTCNIVSVGSACLNSVISIIFNNNRKIEEQTRRWFLIKTCQDPNLLAQGSGQLKFDENC